MANTPSAAELSQAPEPSASEPLIRGEASGDSEQLAWAHGEGFRWAFTTMAQGNLALHVGDDEQQVLRRRRAVADQAGVGSFSYMNQIHSTHVHKVDGTEEPVFSSEAAELRDAVTADALVSRGEPVAVLVADCVPVLVAARSEQGALYTGAAHAGRRGLLDGIIPETMDALAAMAREDGSRLASAEVLIGPSVCGSCYEVPQQMQEESEQIMPGISSRTSWDTPALDLPEACRTQALQWGQQKGVCVQVQRTGPCTVESRSHSSHRREPSSGRIAGLIFADPADAGAAR